VEDDPENFTVGIWMPNGQCSMVRNESETRRVLGESLLSLFSNLSEEEHSSMWVVRTERRTGISHMLTLETSGEMIYGERTRGAQVVRVRVSVRMEMRAVLATILQFATTGRFVPDVN